MSAQRHGVASGEWQETYSVAPGDTLSHIAVRFRNSGWGDLKDWHPIYRVTRLKTGLWRDKAKPNQVDNPDLIHPGDLLVIPRTRRGYEQAIRKIEAVARDAAAQPHRAARLKNRVDAFSDRLNLLSDVLIFCVSLGVNAKSAAKAAKSSFKAAAKKHLQDHKLDSVELGGKIVEFGLKSTGHKTEAEHVKDVGKVVHAVNLGNRAHEFKGTVDDLAKSKRYWRLAGEAAAEFIDILDIYTEYADTARVSKAMVQWLTGSDIGLDAELDHQIEYEERARAQLAGLLKAKVASLRAEMMLVYPSGS